jgi:hypothetical protein
MGVGSVVCCGDGWAFLRGVGKYVLGLLD